MQSICHLMRPLRKVEIAIVWCFQSLDFYMYSLKIKNYYVIVIASYSIFIYRLESYSFCSKVVFSSLIVRTSVRTAEGMEFDAHEEMLLHIYLLILWIKGFFPLIPQVLCHLTRNILASSEKPGIALALLILKIVSIFYFNANFIYQKRI